MALASLTDLKALLGLGSCSDAAQDALLQGLLDLVEELILKRTGFTFTLSGNTEQWTNVQLGRPRYTQYRPIAPASTDPQKLIKLSARSLVSSTFSDILGDILDEFEGKVLPLASELTPVFPPMGGTAPWLRWRQMIWPVVKVTYSIVKLGDGTGGTIVPPKALSTAALQWAAFIYSRPGGGSTSTISVMQLSETYVERSEPTLVRALLSPYTRQQARMVF